MTVGIIWRHIVDFALPMAAGLLFQQLYNTVDTIIVGNFVGKLALAAVGSTMSIINTLVGFCAGLATGASVVIAQRFGAHDEKGLSNAVHTAILLTVILSIIATILGVQIVSPMLKFSATPADVFPESYRYLTIYFQGVAGLIFYNMGSGILRAVGDSKRPLYFLLVSASLNIVLDLLFVVQFSWGIAGVAYATIISQGVSAVLVLISLMRSDGAYAVNISKLRIEKEALKEILRIGFPSGIQQALTAFSNVFVQSYINAYGAACMAGYSAYLKLDTFLTIPTQSFGLAAQTFVGQNYGAQNLPRARDGVKTTFGLSLSVTAIVAVIMMTFRMPLLRIISSEADVLDYGSRFILIVTPFYLLMATHNILSGTLRGIGDAKRTTIIMLSSFVVFRQIFLYVTTKLGVGFLSIALAFPMGWGLCALLLFIVYMRGPIVNSQKSINA